MGLWRQHQRLGEKVTIMSECRSEACRVVSRASQLSVRGEKGIPGLPAHFLLLLRVR